MVKTDILGGCFLFSDAPDEVIRPVHDIAELARVPAGALIFGEGENAQHLFILQDGQVTLSMTFIHEGRTLHVNIKKVRPGELFGWSALTTAHTLSAQAVADDDCEVIRIPAAKLRRLMDADPRLGYHVMSRLTDLASSRLRDTRDQLRVLLGW